jgi:sugar phosphate isomerase/epimerase
MIIRNSILSLLLGACAAGPAWSADAARDESGATKLGWKLGMQAWTFHTLSLFETLDRAHTLGLKYIEFFPGQKLSPDSDAKFDHNSPPEMREKVKAKLKETGITVMNYGVVGTSKDEAASRKVFDFAKDMGIQTIVSEPGDDAFDTLDKLVKEYGINLAIHNHPKPSHYWHPEILLKNIKGHDPRIGSCSDTGHWPRSALVPIDCLKQLEGHVLTLHLKDTNDIAPGVHDVPYGTGKADVKGQLAELKRQGFKGYMSIEYESGPTPEAKMADVATCIAFFDKATAELAEAK